VLNLDINDQFLIFYPSINHPILTKRLPLRKKYIALLWHYLKEFKPDDSAVYARMQQLHQLLLGGETADDVDLSAANKSIMRTRSAPCKLYSYRYLFLFDCIYILSPTDEQLAKDICAVLKSNVSSRYHPMMDSISTKMFSPDPVYPGGFIPKEMFACWVQMRRFLKSPQKTITLTATMSAGKSTLINTLIGQELSFAKKAACTGTTIEFISASATNPVYHIISEQEELFNLSPNDVHSYTNGQTAPCTIIGHFSSPFEVSRIRLIDTPGVDSSRNPEHKEITRATLENIPSDILLYVIPVANYGSEDDYVHLSYVLKKAKYRKIIFVLNMMDECDSEDDSVEDIVSNVRAHLEKIGFSNPVICPVSARAGFVLKSALHGEKLTDTESKAAQAFFHKFNDSFYTSLAYKERIPDQKFTKSDEIIYGINKRQFIKSYANTGIPHLESVLLKTIVED
jgi:GTPase Era involved in 16S rRNA processing